MNEQNWETAQSEAHSQVSLKIYLWVEFVWKICINIPLSYDSGLWFFLLPALAQPLVSGLQFKLICGFHKLQIDMTYTWN